MIDLKLQNYIDWHVKPVMKIKKGYGFRVILKYQDGSEHTQQKSGFRTKKEAELVRTSVIGELYSSTYCVYPNVKVSEFMELWLENNIKKRVGSYETYNTFRGNVKNHINPIIGKKRISSLNKGIIQELYNQKAEYSVSVAKMVKAVMNLAMRYAVEMKVISINPAEGVELPKKVKKNMYHVRSIDTQNTLNLEQIYTLIEASKATPIYIQVLFNVLMGLRRSEIIAVKYSDIDYVNRTLKVKVQLGKKLNTSKEDFAPKTFTKQEVKLKSISSERELPIPDYVFEAILRERQKYEKNKSRRKKQFQDLDYICCSAYGRPRSKSYHWSHYKKLLKNNNLPDITWHDLRSTYCTLLLKNQFSAKAVSKLMGHAKEIITVDVYGDNKEIIAEGVPEIEQYMERILPEKAEKTVNDLTDIKLNIDKYFVA